MSDATIPSSPVAETLWGYCLFQEMARARKEGRTTVQFSAVDELVLEMSKTITNWKLPEGGTGHE